ncbi:hypothetical protein [Streptomyces sp. B21-083]|uniref:hypothetical protein n=1 Tax=Streptomyces sp. B21-083 TaxID=3039410 RepID=UPI002FEF8373
MASSAWQTWRSGLRSALTEGHRRAAAGHYVQLYWSVQLTCQTDQKVSSDRQDPARFQRYHRIGGHSEAFARRMIDVGQGMYANAALTPAASRDLIHQLAHDL